MGSFTLSATVMSTDVSQVGVALLPSFKNIHLPRGFFTISVFKYGRYHHYAFYSVGVINVTYSTICAELSYIQQRI